MIMEDGDIDFSNPEVFSAPPELPNSCSMDSFFDEILKDTHACTHTHICNPPGTDLPHSHTCYHVHHKIFSPPTDESAESVDKNPTKKRSSGNREAVKKYREKKKARTASLEEEVAHLRAVNQQLMKRLQGQAALESEVARLRCLLVDIRGRIEGEIGSFPYQKPGNVMLQGNSMGGVGGAHVLNSCEDLRCEDQAYCLRPGVRGKGGGEVVTGNGQGCGPCEIGNIQCMGSSSLGTKEAFVCGRGNGMAAGSTNMDEIMGAHCEG